MLCGKEKETRDEWVLKSHVKLCKTISFRLANGKERNITQAVIVNIKLYFNNEEIFVRNKSIVGFNHVFQGFVLK